MYKIAPAATLQVAKITHGITVMQADTFAVPGLLKFVVGDPNCDFGSGVSTSVSKPTLNSLLVLLGGVVRNVLTADDVSAPTLGARCLPT